jgi:hypothetical protein
VAQPYYILGTHTVSAGYCLDIGLIARPHPGALLVAGAAAPCAFEATKSCPRPAARSSGSCGGGGAAAPPLLVVRGVGHMRVVEREASTLKGMFGDRAPATGVGRFQAPTGPSGVGPRGAGDTRRGAGGSIRMMQADTPRPQGGC